MRHLRTLFANRRLQILLLFVIPMALFFFMRAQLSWRPRVLGQVQGQVTAMVWSPDGKWLALATALEDASAPVEVWNVPQRKLHGRLKTKAGFHNFLQFSTDSRKFFALDGNLVLRSWSVSDKSELKPSSLSINLLGFALSPDGSTMVQCETDIVGRRTSDGKILWRLNDPLAVVALARFSSDGKKLALLMWQSSFVKGAAIVVWSLDSQKMKAKPDKIIPVNQHHVKSYGLTYAPDENLAYLMGGFGEIFCYDLSSGHLKAKFDPAKQESAYWGDYERVAAFAQHNLFANVAASSGPSTPQCIQLREWPSGKVRRTLRSKNHAASFRLPLFSPDGDTLAAVDDKGFIVLWRIK
ncbi:MAG TPA: WD40 repeat domain-containing protein [Abditibacteriaceae bacterium]